VNDMKTRAEGEWTIEFDPKGKAVRVALMSRGSNPFTIEMDAAEAQRFAREQLKMAKQATDTAAAAGAELAQTAFLFRLGESPEFVVSAENAMVFFRQLIETAQKARDGIN
jgi:hypothetical protein